VVVSNRLPFTVEPAGDSPRVLHSPGGLVSAVDPVLRERGGVWIGWNGIDRDEAPALAEYAPEGPPGLRYRTVPLSAREVSRYYEGFSNRTLWPLFHYFVGRTRIDGRTWRVYESVNQRFADIVARESAGEPLIWVHDYQLLLVPQLLRRQQPSARIAFFLHIPFPATDVFRVLPWSRALLRGMLAADLVAFHVPTYAEHFLQAAERLLGSEVDRRTGMVHFEGREVTVQAHPIGIDAATMAALAAEAPPSDGGERVRRVLGVDRLDYTKGINERLRAVERLFEAFPVHRRRVVFTQVLVPSRARVAEYGELKREIDETVGRINGRFSEPGWTPIRYLVRSLPADELAALYRQADVALVTPLRDGMNLVAKEYVAAQVENDGVLVLSELAGAGEELQEAVLVNPLDIDAVAEALHRALTMPEEERRARMSALRDRVRTNDVHAWVRRVLQEADTAALRARESAESPVYEVQRALARWLGQRPTTALFFDYDGTLTPHTPRPEDAVLSDVARAALEQAARAPNVDVVIVSGRALADVQAMVGVPGITYVGNHGFEIEGPGISYRHPDAAAHGSELEAAGDELGALGIEGGWVERKGPTVSYPLRQVADDAREDAGRRAVGVLRKHGLRALVGHAVVEGRPPVEWHKGRAVLYVLRQRHGTDWPSRVRPLYIGDDATDEDAFRSLRGIGRSVCVAITARTSAADYRLPDPPAVVQLLRWLASGGFLAGG
jgi:trehalose 6-phosphate synthase/phosphatase